MQGMENDPHGCKADYLQEMIDYTLEQLHIVGECDGAKGGCWLCQDEECNSLNSKSE